MTRKRMPARFYCNINGIEPVREWLLSIDKQDRALIGQEIKTVEYGWPIGMPTCRSMGGGLWEVRSNLSNGKIARVLFCCHAESLILLHGFIKKTQKTPKTDLDLAKKRKQEVENA